MPISMHHQSEADAVSLLPFRVLPLCDLSVLGLFEIGGADPDAIPGESCADPELSSPYRKTPRVSRKDEQMASQIALMLTRQFFQAQTILHPEEGFLPQCLAKQDGESAGWSQCSGSVCMGRDESLPPFLQAMGLGKTSLKS